MTPAPLPQLLTRSLPLPQHERFAPCLPLIEQILTWLAPRAARLGLTKYDSPMSLAENLAIPVFSLLEILPEAPRLGPVLDFGAGAGVVGFTYAALFPKSKIVLADRRTRVVQFLDLAVHEFSLANCASVVADLTHPTGDQAGSFGLVLLRAFAPGPEALEAATPWLKSGGHVAFWHRPPAPDVPEMLQRGDSVATNVPSLSLTLYQRQ
jgi:16S rRNA G527 N7-methylase RsmG